MQEPSDQDFLVRPLPIAGVKFVRDSVTDTVDAIRDLMQPRQAPAAVPEEAAESLTAETDDSRGIADQLAAATPLQKRAERRSAATELKDASESNPGTSRAATRDRLRTKASEAADNLKQSINKSVKGTRADTGAPSTSSPSKKAA